MSETRGKALEFASFMSSGLMNCRMYHHKREDDERRRRRQKLEGISVCRKNMVATPTSKIFHIFLHGIISIESAREREERCKKKNQHDERAAEGRWGEEKSTTKSITAKGGKTQQRSAVQCIEHGAVLGRYFPIVSHTIDRARSSCPRAAKARMGEREMKKKLIGTMMYCMQQQKNSSDIFYLLLLFYL